MKKTNDERKDKKAIDSIAQEQMQDYRKQKKQTLILTVMLLSGGFLAAVTAVMVAGSPVEGPQTGRMVSMTLVIGLIGIFSGFYLLYRYKKLRKMEEQERKTHSS